MGDAFGAAVLTSLTGLLSLSVIAFYTASSVLFKLESVRPAQVSFSLAYAMSSLAFIGRLVWAYEQGQRLSGEIVAARMALQNFCYER